MRKFITITILLLVSVFVYSQNTITGAFPGIADQQIKLFGFNGFDTYVIDSVKANEKGEFKLTYSVSDYGMGYLSAQDNKPFFVVLEGKRRKEKGESMKLWGESFFIAESVEIIKGHENQLFARYAAEHPRREQAISAWGYLEKIYTKDSLFNVQEIPKQIIDKEKQRIKTEDSLFLAKLPENSYVSYYLPLRKLVSSVSTIAQYRTEQIPATIQAFRQIDYTDKRLHKSGMLKGVIESHFWLIENSGRSLDSVYIEMQISIDCMLENLLNDEQKLNEVTEHLFKFLEQRSLFTASEYLAIKLLNEKACTLNSDFSSQLESYRAMKKGNIAPDIFFTGDVSTPGYLPENKPKKLSEIRSNYNVVVFGASWCPQCPKELQEISKNYVAWKQQDVEVVFVSLDENKQTFESFIKPFSFISICDFKKWESKAVKDYHVFATPTIYMLNSELEIILKPNSVSQLNSWIDWYLVQGNK
jgi:thiol-disulfide isomerase/thioredoxin